MNHSFDKASLLGSLRLFHRATVSGILGDLERRDLIARERSKISRIVIPNMGKLHMVLKDAGCGDVDEGGVGQERAVGRGGGRGDAAPRGRAGCASLVTAPARRSARRSASQALA